MGQSPRTRIQCNVNGCLGWIEFYVEPLLRGRYSGPPEQCYEDEGGFAEPASACTYCGRDATEDDDIRAYEQYEADCKYVDGYDYE